jgi:hypothetical protein
LRRKETVMTLLDAATLGWLAGVISLFLAMLFSR